jgi:hypothetical protein
MFTVVWPLAPLCCLPISALEQRASAMRLTVGCQRPAAGLRSDGLGTGNAWFHVLQLLAWISVPINSGMIALATTQLDDALHLHGQLAETLPPFEKLLVAVVAEHVLLAAKLAIGISFAESSTEAASHAGQLAEMQRRTYLRRAVEAEAGVAMAEATASAPAAVAPSKGGSEPRLTSVFPTSGSCAAGAAVSLRGERLGNAVSRGELTLMLTLPKSNRPVSIPATFISERKITACMPPSVSAGTATIALVLPDAKSSRGGAPPTAGSTLSFTYYGVFSAHRLRPSSGPIGGGMLVQMLGAGFVPTDEATACLRLRGVERRVPATFISEHEVRFLAPSFSDAGEARVTLSLNGQEHEPRTELLFHFTSPSWSCAVM